MTLLTTAFRYRHALARGVVAALAIGLVALLLKVCFRHPTHARPAPSDLPFRAGIAGERHPHAFDLYSPVPQPMEGRSLQCQQAAGRCLNQIFSSELRP